MADEDDAPRPVDGSQFLWRYVWRVSSLGMIVVAWIFLFFLGGLALDRYFSLGAAGIFVSIVLGAVSALYWASRRVSSLLKQMAREEAGGAQAED